MSSSTTQRVEQVEADVTQLVEKVGSIETRLEGMEATMEMRFAHLLETIKQMNPKGHESGVGERVDTGGGEDAGRRHRRLELPLFEGENPDGWILRMERYFRFQQLPESEQIEAAVVALEGDALLWYQFEHRRHPIRSWEGLKLMLLRHFRRTDSGTLYEQWLSHEMVGDYGDYKRRFVEFLAPLEGVSEEVILGQFIKGLEENIKGEVRLFGPRSLEGAMELAGRISERWAKRDKGPFKEEVSKPRPNSKYSPYTSINPALIYSSKNQSTQNTYSQTSQNSNPISPRSRTYSNSQPSPNSQRASQFWKLNERELQEKREKGLCFRCDGKWGVGHVCEKKKFIGIITQLRGRRG